MERKDFIVLRHSYDDHSYIDGKNDTGLTTKGIEMAKEAADKMLYRVDSDSVIIRHSTKKRAVETSEIIAELLLKNNIEVQCIKDYGLTELFQGDFNFGDMEHKARIDFLQSCWDDFEACREKGILTHRFGQNKDRNVILTPGESHSMWSVRIGQGLLNIIEDLQNNKQSINVTHRGATFVLRNLVELLNGNLPIEEVEKYKTSWMSYCQDYTFYINDLEKSKTLVKRFIDERKNK